MSEEVVRFEEAVIREISIRNIILAGWPKGQVEAMHSLLENVVPASGVLPNSRPQLPNPFSERLSQPRDPANVDLIRRALGYDDRTILLVFIEDVTSVVAREFANAGQSDLKVLEDWQVATDRLIAVANSDEERVKIVSINDVFAAPHAFVEYLSELLSWPLQLGERTEMPTRHKWDEFYLMVACQYIQERDEIRRLEGELRSSRDFVPASLAGSHDVDWSVVVQDVEAMRKENCALLEMLHKVQLDFEQAAVELGQKDAQLKQSTYDAKQAEDELEGVVKDLETKCSELDKVRTRLNDERDHRRQTVEKLKATQKARKQAEASANAVLGSTTWKLAAPLRSVSALLRK